MKFYKYINDIPDKPIVGGEETEFNPGDTIMVRKGTQENYHWEQYKVAADGLVHFVRGITDDQWGRVERLNDEQVTKLEGLDTQQEIDGKLSEIATNAVSSLVPVEGTVLPRGGDIPEYITTRGRADLYGGSGGSVTYTNTGLPSPDDTIVVPQGSVMQAFYDKSTDTWSEGPSQVLPTDPNAVKKNQIDSPNGVVGFNTFSGVTVIGSSQSNVVDINSAEHGLIVSSNGVPQSSANWLRIPYSAIPEGVKGTHVTVYRESPGRLPDGANLVSFRDSSGVFMAGDSVQGYANFPRQTVVFVPENADMWAFTIVNVEGVVDPVNNPYTQGFSVVTEEVESVLLDETKINNPDNIVFNNPITKNGTGAVPAKELFVISEKVGSIVEASSNMADMSVDVVSGFWTITGGHTDSNNWIKKQRTPFNQQLIDRLINGEELYLWVFGGGTVSASGASVVFWDEEDNLVFSQQGTGGSTFPLRVEIPISARSIGVTIANVVGIGDDPLNNPYRNTFYIGLEQEENTQPEYQDYGYVIKPSAIPELNVKSVDTSEIIFRKINDGLFHIYFHIGGPSNLWFRINLRHQISEAKFIDVWRIEQGWVVQRSGDDFINVREIVMAGVYENAIYTNGYSDALGSAHGWEILEHLNVWMDGSELDILSDDFQEARGRVFSFNTLTSFRTANGLGEVGKSFKTWIFKDGVFEIDNNINWTANLQVSNTGRSFLGMLSIKRDDASGNITHSAQSNEDGVTYDVSVEGFTTPIFTDQQNPRRNTLTVWGDEFKAVVSLSRKIINPDGTENTIGYNNAGGFVQNSNLYNKMYLTIGAGSVEPGSSWVTKTTYNLFNKMK